MFYLLKSDYLTFMDYTWTNYEYIWWKDYKQWIVISDGYSFTVNSAKVLGFYQCV